MAVARSTMLLHKEITQKIIDAFFVSYNHLGFGFSEAIYAAALQHELVKAGVRVDREVKVYVRYPNGTILGWVRLDMLVENKIVVETKTLRALPEETEHQVFHYLRSTNLEVGLMLNYGPRPKVKRYLCTNDRKHGLDLREGTIAPFVNESPEVE
jgi:GxxExxY protein